MQWNPQTFESGGCKSYENSDLEAKIRGVVSGEKLHDFEIICPASGVRTGLYPDFFQLLYILIC